MASRYEDRLYDRSREEDEGWGSINRGRFGRGRSGFGRERYPEGRQQFGPSEYGRGYRSRGRSYEEGRDYSDRPYREDLDREFYSGRGEGRGYRGSTYREDLSGEGMYGGGFGGYSGGGYQGYTGGMSNYGGANYGRSSGYYGRGPEPTGRWTDYPASESGYRTGRGQMEEDRGWFDRASDEVASWFGDDEAERRRDMDARRYGSHRGRGPRNYTRSDDRIREDINDRLTYDDFLDASDIDVQVNNGEVVLTGTVESRYAKRLAEDIAEDVSGTRNVENRIRVEPSTWSTTASPTTSRTTASTGTSGTQTGTAGRSRGGAAGA